MALELCVWWIEEGDQSYPDFYQATLEWIESLGLNNPYVLGPRAGVVQRGDTCVLLYDEIDPTEQAPRDWDPLNCFPPPPATARRELVVEPNTWPDRRKFGVPLWSATARIAHVNLNKPVAVA